MIATFKAGNKRKTTHSHLFLPKNYSGDPYTAVLIFTPYTEAEVLAFLETGWGIGNVADLQLSFLHGAEEQALGFRVREAAKGTGSHISL